jgi:hypothetical protein
MGRLPSMANSPVSIASRSPVRRSQVQAQQRPLQPNPRTSGPGPRQTAKLINVTGISNGLSIAAKLPRSVSGKIHLADQQQAAANLTSSLGWVSDRDSNFFSEGCIPSFQPCKDFGYRNIAVTPEETRESGTAWLLETISEWILQSRQFGLP